MIELLVVVAILGVLAAVAVPNVGKFIGKGKTEALEVELHNIQTGTMAMLADGTSGNITTPIGPIYTMTSVTSLDGVTVITLNTYLTGLGDSPTTTGVTETDAPKSGASYTFLADGTVTQTIP